MSEAFSAAKQALVSATVLIHPNPSARISLAVDTSDTHVGAVLQQFHNGGWAPLSFFLRQLDSAQSKYSTFSRELLAAYLAVRHFWYMLGGRKFHIQTDHKPLIHALSHVLTPLSASWRILLNQISVISLVWIMWKQIPYPGRIFLPRSINLKLLL